LLSSLIDDMIVFIDMNYNRTVILLRSLIIISRNEDVLTRMLLIYLLCVTTVYLPLFPWAITRDLGVKE